MTTKKFVIVCSLLIILALIGFAVFIDFTVGSHGRPVVRHTAPTQKAKHEVLPTVATYTPGFDNFDRSTGRRLRGVRRPNLPAVVEANRRGALAKTTIHVSDSTGRDVANAQITGQFSTDGEGARPFKSVTDNSGRVVLEEQCRGEAYYAVKKEGHYDTRGQYWFLLEGEDCVKDGRWIPWNPTLDVVLKEKRKPIPMLLTWEAKVILPKDISLGYDCFKKDLVAPYGAGENADFMLIYSSNGKQRLNLENRLSISFSDDCGLIKLPKDMFSEFPSLHEAPMDSYVKEIVFNFARTPSAILKDEGLKDAEYFIMRSRVKKDNDGKIISALYGKFYRFAFDESDDGKTGYLLLQFYVNPTPNDRNLEAEGRYP